jgi:hypothetical protein
MYDFYVGGEEESVTLQNNWLSRDFGDLTVSVAGKYW